MDSAMRLQSVVDDEFRAEYLAAPRLFGRPGFPLPDPIEPPGQEPLDFRTDDAAATEPYARRQTCTHGSTLYC